MELEELIQKFLSGQLTPAEAERLLAELKQDRSVGEQLFDHLQMHDLLLEISKSEKLFLETLPDDETFPDDRPRNVVSLSRPSRRVRWDVSLSWATALAACLLLLLGFGLRLRSKHAASEESTTYAVATLARMANAEWADAGQARGVGAALDPGWLRLKAGVVQVEFFNGASVLLEGPVEFQVISAKEAFCRSGKLSAEAPPSAHGFRIRTPQMNVVDLGTAFGLDVNTYGTAVHVFKGQVELDDQFARKQLLKQGEAVSVAQNGAMNRFLASHDTFTSVGQLDRSARAEQRQRQNSWRAASARLNADPGLIVHFDFEGATPYGGTLRNLATNAPAVGDATIVGCSLGQGRWQGKSALEFSGVTSRVLLNVPGEFNSLTYAAWVRVNSLANNYNSLFMCDGFNLGAPHWQILRSGAVRLGIANADAIANAEYDTPVIFTPDRLGQWVHLAVVYDAVAKQVAHFVNGEVVRRLPLQFESHLRLGPTQLGNWNRGDYTIDATPIRNFSGRLDEFEFFNRPLDNNEIRELYQEGSPQAGNMNVAEVAPK